MTVLGLGKLGGGELGYASDLDLVFVYGADGESDGARPLPNVTYMTRLAQRLQQDIADQFNSVLQTIEIAALLRRRQAQDEDDEDVLLMLL